MEIREFKVYCPACDWFCPYCHGGDCECAIENPAEECDEFFGIDFEDYADRKEQRTYYEDEC